MIGDDIIVTILGIKNNQARVGIHAPDDMAVHREEIYRRIQQEKQNEFDAEADTDREPG